MALVSSETDSSTPGTDPERNSFIPPYWQRHERNASRLSSYSSDNGRPTPIALEDHTEEGSDQLNVLWCKGVTIDDYVVVSGTAKGLGAYVVWNCTVETLDGGPMKIRKRYSEFEDLRQKLVTTFPQAGGSMPQFPPKSVISRFRPRFLEKRKEGLTYFLNCVLLNPEFAGSPVLKEFLFA
ncbi:PX-domain-containing protein [Dothidotthia symphoricarpi CBS 119687]|uniref:Endosomal/vacuolar adapter protein YPT35 n=1 Tax=Dothidotthia symphoricarpi CBS 119687 TaxID=1392245 RepID=A0A6A6ANQ9_9PLEO|nr:PX-domain-containing protein [Dothidotthia symphoricarpi CBS 119687]KAF2132778.1 PX-domain-containing protein [Dothidotthia symphoricarpi CBS 119687]